MNQSIKLLLAVILIPSFLHGQEINWETDIEVAIQRATQQRKPLLLHCWYEACGPCRKLENFVFTNPEVIRAFNENVVPVKVNTETQEEVAIRFGVKSVPHDIFLTPGGYNLLSRPSPQSATEYIEVLNSAKKLYQTQDALITGGLNQKPIEQELSQFGGKVQHVNSFTGKAGMQVDRMTGSLSRTPGKGGDDFDQFRSESSFQPNNESLATSQTQTFKPTEQNNLASPNPYFENSRPVSTPASHIEAEGTAGSNIVFNPFIKGSKPPQNTQQYQPPTSDPRQYQPQAVQPDFNRLRKPAPAQTHQEKQHIEPKPRTKAPAFDGYCPVSLQTERKWKKGSKQWGCFHRGRLFLFQTAAYREQFVIDPDKYCPALAGYDPVVYAETGRLVEGKRQIGVFYPATDPLIYVFGSEDSKKKFQANPSKFFNAVRVATAECDANNGDRLHR